MDAEKRVQKLIHLVLLWGVWTSGTLMAAGLAISLGSGNGAVGERVMLGGILLLIFTPVLRLLMLCFGYARAGGA